MVWRQALRNISKTSARVFSLCKPSPLRPVCQSSYYIIAMARWIKGGRGIQAHLRKLDERLLMHGKLRITREIMIRGYKFSSFINHWVEMSWDEGQAREFKWRGKVEMRGVCRSSIIRSAFIVSFGIGLPAPPAAPIDKGDKCTHRTFRRGRRRTTLDDD